MILPILTILIPFTTKDNQGKILIANVDISKAKWVNKGNGVFQAADQKWQLKLIGTDWEITGMNGSSLKSKIIVKDAALTATAFGLTLPKAASASSRSVSANEHAFLTNSISAANNLISAMSNLGKSGSLNLIFRLPKHYAPPSSSSYTSYKSSTQARTVAVRLPEMSSSQRCTNAWCNAAELSIAEDWSSTSSSKIST
ncbi:Uncharacterised protein [Alysiella crassa]|uniref:Uncharacterized protein n=1 Tax=Alysiella crassa TaxID=153491 RepID=A0A376BMH6_9NEIS|nr:Uncharacterised protein [Alysiella crassa]